MILNREIGNVQLMQRINRLKVLECIRQKDMVARPEIAKTTGLSPSSITNIVSFLIDKNYVTEVGTVDSKEVGRKATLLKFNPRAFDILSVNIETGNVCIAITDMNGQIYKMKEVPIDPLMKDYEILNVIKREINGFVNGKRENPHSSIAGIGVSVSGLIQSDGKLVISSSLRWRGISLKEYFENSFNLPVFVQNTSRTKAISELNISRSKLEKNILFLDLAMGVGVINFYDGKVNEAVIGEFGHTSVQKDGPLCFCGNRGCLEVICSVESIVNRCNELLKQGRGPVLQKLMKDEGAGLSYKTILKAFEDGDTDISEVLKECGEYLGLGIANLINMFNPQRIIINGDALLASDYIYEVAVNEANKRAYELFIKDLKYEKVEISREMTIKGISMYVTECLLSLSEPYIF